MRTKKEIDPKLLEFSDPNGKLRQLDSKEFRIATFSIPAGWTCPSADICFARTLKEGGLIRGENMMVQCFSASQENLFPAVRAQRWRNLKRLQECGKDVQKLAELIVASIPEKANCVRIHIGGDFYSRDYFLGWCTAARMRPEILFYAYTKSLKIWVANREAVPSNLVLTASVGGKDDELIAKHSLKNAEIVYSIEEANGRPIDHDDTHAMDPNCQAFVLLIHNVQPAGSKAAKAVQALKGLGSYSDKKEINKARAELADKAAA